MKFKLIKDAYTALFNICNIIKTPDESKVTASSLIEKIREEAQKSEEPEEITIELEQYELANLSEAFKELVKGDKTTAADIGLLKLLATSLRFSNAFKKFLEELAKTQKTVELDPIVDLELDPE